MVFFVLLKIEKKITVVAINFKVGRNALSICGKVQPYLKRSLSVFLSSRGRKSRSRVEENKNLFHEIFRKLSKEGDHFSSS